MKSMFAFGFVVGAFVGIAAFIVFVACVTAG